MNQFLELYTILNKLGGRQLNILGITIGYDKFLHIYIIVVFGLVIQFILKLFNITSFSINFAILSIISIGKEFFDLFIKYNFFSFADLGADFIGIIIVYLIILYFYKK